MLMWWLMWWRFLITRRPRRVDIAALAEGKLTELINLVPLGGVELDCIALRLAGLQVGGFRLGKS